MMGERRDVRAPNSAPGEPGVKMHPIGHRESLVRGFMNERVAPRGLARAQAAGFATTVYTVNEAARMLELASLGVSGIFTDRPDLARRTLAPPSG